MIDRETIDWDTWTPKLFRVMRSRCYWFRDPDDMAQKVVIRLWKGIEAGKAFDNEASVWAYTFAIYRTTRIEAMRRAEMRTTWYSLDIPDHDHAFGDALAVPVADTCDDPRIDTVLAILPTLPEPHRHALQCLAHGVKGQEMARRHPDRYPTSRAAYKMTEKALDMMRRALQKKRVPHA